MYIVALLIISIFLISAALLEFFRKDKTQPSRNPYIVAMLYTVSSVFAIAMTASVLKNNILYLQENDCLRISLDNIVDLICSAIFIVLFGHQVARFIMRYRVVKEITDEMLLKYHVLFKQGAKEFFNYVFSVVDNVFGFGIFSILKGTDNKIINGAKNIYIGNRLKESNIELTKKYIPEYVYMLIQDCVLCYFDRAMTQDEYEVFVYCEEEIQMRNNPLKSTVPMEIFQYHKYLVESSESDDWRKYESYLIDELTYFNYKYFSYSKIAMLRAASKNLYEKLNYSREKEEEKAYINQLINYIFENYKSGKITSKR